jgi:hypothetical protein
VKEEIESKQIPSISELVLLILIKALKKFPAMIRMEIWPKFRFKKCPLS